MDRIQEHLRGFFYIFYGTSLLKFIPQAELPLSLHMRVDYIFLTLRLCIEVFLGLRGCESKGYTTRAFVGTGIVSWKLASGSGLKLGRLACGLHGLCALQKEISVFSKNQNA